MKARHEFRDPLLAVSACDLENGTGGVGAVHSVADSAVRPWREAGSTPVFAHDGHWLPGGDAGVVAGVIGCCCGGLGSERAQAAFGAGEHAGIQRDLLAQQPALRVR